MSDRIYAGKNAQTVTRAKKLPAYTKVVLICGENDNGEQIVFESGNDTGRTLEVNVPLIDAAQGQSIADSVLASVKDYQYQPFEAGNVFIDPAAELGDTLTVADIYGVIGRREIKFDVSSLMDIEAPAESAEEHELSYTNNPNRTITRKIRRVESSLRLTVDGIVATVQDHERSLGQTVRLSADGLTITNAAGSTLTIDGGQLKADSISASAIKTSELTVGGNITVANGSITFANLNTATQNAINNRGISASQARTIITDELVSAPTIAGGAYWNRDPSTGERGNGYLTLTPSYWGYGVQMELSTSAHTGSNGLFSIDAMGNDGTGSAVTVRMKVNGTRILELTETGAYLYASDFMYSGMIRLSTSNATSSNNYGSSLPTTNLINGRLFFLTAS